MVLDLGLKLLTNSVSDSIEISMLNRWRKEYAAYQKQVSRRTAILSAIEQGYDTVIEISAHTGIPGATVRRILLRLISSKTVRSAKTKNMNHRIEFRFELASHF